MGKVKPEYLGGFPPHKGSRLEECQSVVPHLVIADNLDLRVTRQHASEHPVPIVVGPKRRLLGGVGG
eukprot:CAMPEP_0114156600 /NCGR_PEP_ID=MMETSP0043_2-20121206/26145_1 /TAXON_ID=464988 /ORGANISM="Hemiselmis andersenii, Strain CCMP644" /LENGTH=66 /DNA_ID=CAMNT_0001252053 /DNA_START=56 /DNA_END=252 /DNA_ORIENTATION=-